jgi:hypothetical protein
MPEPSRRRAALSVLAAIVALCGAWSGGAWAAQRAGDPVRVTVAFDAGATLGSATALDVDLLLDPRRLTNAPLNEVRFEYPASLGLVSSGLGLATCIRPPSDFAQVLISATGLAGCPVNAVMGFGTARAVVRLVSGQVIPEYASVTLLAGPVEHGRLGLVVYVDGERPFGAKLAFAGDVGDSPAPYGGALAVRMPTIPNLQDVATVSLVELRIVIGSHAIRYRERRRGRVVTYHPDGIELPARCPRGGFPFRVRVAFADRSRRVARSRTACPPAVAAPSAAR